MNIIKVVNCFAVLGLLLGFHSMIGGGFSNANTLHSPVTWYVDDDGGADYTKIQDAINAASDGDTVFVYSGFYEEYLYVDKSVSLEGENRQTTIIDGGGDWGVYVVADYFSISGFTIQNSEKNLFYNCTSTTIMNNTVLSSNTHGISIWNCSHNTIFDNTISDNKVGICLCDVDDTSIIHNKISGNEWGIHCDNSTNCNVSYNLVSNNSHVGILSFDTKATILRNIIKDNWCATFITGNQELTITENNFIDHHINIHFVKPNQITWDGNYWQNWPSVLPRPILGMGLFPITPLGFPIPYPAIDFDFHPAKEPYDINIDS